MLLVTMEDFAAFLRRDLDDLDAYAALLLLTAASEAVVEYAGWHIAPEVTETITVDGSGLVVQALPTLCLAELVAVTDNGAAQDVTQIDWSTYGVMEKRTGGSWTSRRRGVQAEIRHGFADTPAWLATMICALAGRAMTTSVGIAAESAGGESVTYATPYLAPPGSIVLLDMEKTMLSRISLPSAA